MKPGTIGKGSSSGVIRSGQIPDIALKVESVGFLVWEKENALWIKTNHNIFYLSNWKYGASNHRNREDEGKLGILRESGFRTSIVGVLNLRCLLGTQVAMLNKQLFVQMVGKWSGLGPVASTWTFNFNHEPAWDHQRRECEYSKENHQEVSLGDV